MHLAGFVRFANFDTAFAGFYELLCNVAALDGLCPCGLGNLIAAIDGLANLGA